MTSQKWIILGVIVALVLLGVLLYTNKKEQLYPERSGELVEPRVEGQGPSTASLAQGKQTYEIRTDKPSDFQIMQVDLDPLNVQVNQTQTITVYVKDKENHPITKLTGVKGVIHTDNGKTKVDFALKQAGGGETLESTGGQGSLITQWQGTWTLQDTVKKQYMATISAFADFGKSSVDLSFR